MYKRLHTRVSLGETGRCIDHNIQRTTCDYMFSIPGNGYRTFHTIHQTYECALLGTMRGFSEWFDPEEGPYLYLPFLPSLLLELNPMSCGTQPIGVR